MKDEHIIKILDRVPLTSLTESELKTIRTHVEHCHECLHAFEAAQISMLLIKGRADETIEPSPFFHTRVMAAIRERKVSVEISAFKRFWKAANSLVYSMTALVIVLVALTIFSTGISTDWEQDAAVNQSLPEEVILYQEAMSDNRLTDEQVFSTIYEP